MIGHSGGRAGPHEVGWLRAGYKRDEVEPLRHFDAWKKRANELVSLSKGTQQRLAYYKKQVTLKKLIRFVKKIRI